MSGSRITDQQVRLYMNHRKHHPQKLAAAKSGMSERTARRVEHEAGLPSQQPWRYWRSRPDPFADVWESEVVPLLRATPKLKAITELAIHSATSPSEGVAAGGLEVRLARQ